jgi:hypothetical protein
MSYFCTCQVIEARLSSCAKAEIAKVKSKNTKVRILFRVIKLLSGQVLCLPDERERKVVYLIVN